MVKKTKNKVRPADTKPKLKPTRAKARTPAVKKLTKRTDASLPNSGKMKQPILHFRKPQPQEIQRPDVAPTKNYSLLVDGQVKALFEEPNAATKAAKELLASYPMLKVEIQDASTKERRLVTN